MIVSEYFKLGGKVTMNESVKVVIETVTTEIIKNQKEFNEMSERNKKFIEDTRERMKKKREMLEKGRMNKNA